ncbi:MAG: hypothetical protein MJA84_12560, partial [Firmicutes bacterium]|nr:hypothetical protein [Bacillota bacterium]
MLKKISNLLIIALLLAAVPTGAALALVQGEEQIVKQEVIMGYFDVWKGNEWQDTNNDGGPDQPGQTGKTTKPFSYSAADKLNEYQLTRVEVKYPFGSDEYIAAGGRQYGPDGKPADMTWDRFRKDYLNYLPQNLSVQVTSKDLAVGEATVQWGLDLIPKEQPHGVLDLKDPEN